MRGQFVWLAAGRAGGALCQAATLGLLARWAGPGDFGLAAAVTGAATTSVVAADLGISATILTLRARDAADGRIHLLQRLNTWSAATLGVLWLVVFAIVSRVSDGVEPVLMLGAAAWVTGERLTETSLMVPLADGQTKVSLYSLLARRGATAVVLILTYASGWSPLVSYGWALATSAVIGVFGVRRLFPRGKAALPLRLTMPLLRAAAPFWLNSLAILARSLDVSVARGSTTPLAAGLYAAPSRLTSPLSLVPTSLAIVVLPHAARGDRSATKSLFRSLNLVMAAMAVLFGLLALVAGPALRIGLGPSYESAATPFRIILVGLVFFGFLASMVSLLQGRGDEWFAAYAAIASTVVCFSAVAVGAHAAGADGAAIGLTTGTVVHTALIGTRLWTTRRRLWLAGSDSEPTPHVPLVSPTVTRHTDRHSRLTTTITHPARKGTLR